VPLGVRLYYSLAAGGIETGVICVLCFTTWYNIGYSYNGCQLAKFEAGLVLKFAVIRSSWHVLFDSDSGVPVSAIGCVILNDLRFCIKKVFVALRVFRSEALVMVLTGGVIRQHPRLDVGNVSNVCRLHDICF